MKRLLRHIEFTDGQHAARVKQKLNDLGFYAISVSDDVIEVYAIKEYKALEAKVTEITEKLIATYGGHLVYTQWGGMLKKILCVVSVLACVLLSACNKWRGLSNTDSPAVANFSGVWVGVVDLDGRTQPVHLTFTQNGTAIGGFSTIDYSGTMEGQNAGQINGLNVLVTIDEGTQCVNKIRLDGELLGTSLRARLFGAGNNIPGTTCYPRPLDITLELHH